MPLQVASLPGFAPNFNPGGGPTTVKGPNPFEQVAIQALSTIIAQGIGNTFQQDYTKQAQAEGLAVDPEAKQAGFIRKFLGGATTDKTQLGELRGQKRQADMASAAEAAANKRHQSTIDANRILSIEGGARDELRQAAEHKNRVQMLADQLRANGNIAAADNLTRLYIADQGNKTTLTAAERGEAGATNRSKANNETAITVANINAESPARLAGLFGAMQKGASAQDFSRMLNPDAPAAPSQLDQLAALNAWLQKIQAEQAPKK